MTPVETLDVARAAGAKEKDNDALELLAATVLFRQCSAEDLAALASCARSSTYAAGSDLLTEGDDATEILIIAEGEAVVMKRGAAIASHEVARLGPGDSLGEMALLDPGTRSATVRALSPVTALVIPIGDILRLAEARPTMVRALVELARLVAARLRYTTSSAVGSLERALAEEQMRTTMGKFTLLLIIGFSLYTWVVGTASQLKELVGRTEFVTIPVIAAIAGFAYWFMKTSGYSARFFGLTLEKAGRHSAEAILFTLPLMAAAVGLKAWLVTHVASMQGEPLFQMFAGSVAFNPWLIVAYVFFVPVQEMIYRGGLQGALEHFLTGRWHRWYAIIGSNIIFATGHLYISPGLSLSAFVAGLFWGWLYSRQRSLVGVSISHILLGFWAFEVVDMGVLE